MFGATTHWLAAMSVIFREPVQIAKPQASHTTQPDQTDGIGVSTDEPRTYADRRAGDDQTRSP